MRSTRQQRLWHIVAAIALACGMLGVAAPASHVKRSGGAAPPPGLIAFWQDGLFVTTAAGRTPKRLTLLSGGWGASSPGWSPNGQSLAFVAVGSPASDPCHDDDRAGCAVEIYVVRSSGSAVRRLTPIGQNSDSPAWAPDARRLVFSYSGGDWSRLAIINADGTGRRRITLPRHIRYATSPDWSPTGHLIAFVGGRSDGSSDAIYVVAPDGRGLRQLTPHRRGLNTGNTAAPVWDPRGKRIAFSGYASSGFPEIFVMNADGSHRRQLTRNQAGYDEIAWSPDGLTIAYAALRGTPDLNRDIHKIGVDGRGARKLTSSGGWNRRPSWSRNGGAVAFECDEGLCLMSADGTKQRLLQRDALHPAWQP